MTSCNFHGATQVASGRGVVGAYCDTKFVNPLDIRNLDITLITQFVIVSCCPLFSGSSYYEESSSPERGPEKIGGLRESLQPQTIK